MKYEQDVSINFIHWIYIVELAYGKLEIECDFYAGYDQMPNRIKDSRNALDHGKLDYQFMNVMFWDTELLRAVIYKMILETAGINDKDKVVNCLKKLSNHPF